MAKFGGGFGMKAVCYPECGAVLRAGAIAAPAAMMKALMDALAPRGVTRLDMPATPLAIWRALQASQQG